MITKAKEHTDNGLKCVGLDLKTVVLTVFIDAGFAGNEDLSSQLGYLIKLRNSTGRININHYGSLKPKEDHKTCTRCRAIRYGVWIRYFVCIGQKG